MKIIAIDDGFCVLVSGQYARIPGGKPGDEVACGPEGWQVVASQVEGAALAAKKEEAIAREEEAARMAKATKAARRERLERELMGDSRYGFFEIRVQKTWDQGCIHESTYRAWVWNDPRLPSGVFCCTEKIFKKKLATKK